MPSLVADFAVPKFALIPHNNLSGFHRPDRLLLLQGGATPHAGRGHVLHGRDGGPPPLHPEPGAAVRAARAAAAGGGSPAVVSSKREEKMDGRWCVSFLSGAFLFFCGWGGWGKRTNLLE